jgi:hypothetical protein
METTTTPRGRLLDRRERFLQVPLETAEAIDRSPCTMQGVASSKATFGEVVPMETPDALGARDGVDIA